MPQGSQNNARSTDGAKSNPMSQSDASRIQSGQARGGGDMSSGGFAARAQSAGDKNANTGATASQGK
ncbi:hypothetical protein DM02DRAFT_704437 [Periconia macrospinosa]|uniref:SMP domain-containing protein n=1 Tax=Periconia macrospinosa TaxID=97972 RepID=A0A2V1D0N0_9PLEO|nr:hypothetical protein DM02DRAFT_704437 [Periconia macrospinosa]